MADRRCLRWFMSWMRTVADVSKLLVISSVVAIIEVGLPILIVGGTGFLARESLQWAGVQVPRAVIIVGSLLILTSPLWFTVGVLKLLHYVTSLLHHPQLTTPEVLRMDVVPSNPIDFVLPPETAHSPRFCVTTSTRGEGRYRTSERYGHVVLTVEPCHETPHITVVWAAPEGLVPVTYFPYIAEGVQKAAEVRDDEGLELMYVISKVRVTIIGGSDHTVNASGRSQMLATVRAFKAAVHDGGLVPLSMDDTHLRSNE